MKAYFNGLGMDGVIDIKEIVHEYYVPIPKKCSLANILQSKEGTDIVQDTPHIMIGRFRYMGMIPVYKLVSIG